MKEGDMKQQFLNAYDETADQVYRFAYMRVSDHDAALDIMQETFTRYWNHLREGKPVAHERALLFTIARRLVIDRYRARQSVSLDILHEEAGFDPAEEHLPSPERDAEGAEALARLNALPETYREPLFLRFVEGYEPREIAEMLGISADAVSVRIHRGVEKLRTLMQ